MACRCRAEDVLNLAMLASVAATQGRMAARSAVIGCAVSAAVSSSRRKANIVQLMHRRWTVVARANSTHASLPACLPALAHGPVTNPLALQSAAATVGEAHMEVHQSLFILRILVLDACT